MANLIEYKCPSCGGVLQFDSATQKLKCPYCDSTFDVDAFKTDDGTQASTPVEGNGGINISISSDTWNEAEAGNFGIYSCSSCGAEIIADETTAATSCPYCNNNVILTGRLAGNLKPDCIIPFKYGKEEAKEALRGHMKGKSLLPKVFSDENHLDEIKGVYVPYWLYDCEADTSASYRMTKVRSWADINYSYTETSHYGADRQGLVDFQNVPADASKSIADELTESLESFDYSELTDFKTAYLAGFFANRYDVPSEECLRRAKERIDISALNTLDPTVQGYATVSRSGGNVQLRNIRVKYALMPVWILCTSWRGDKYLFAMNGQTGKFVGNLPVDKWRYWKYRLLYTGLICAAVYALSIAAQFL